MSENDAAMYHLPTWRERMWRLLGFRYHLGPDPDGIDCTNGWMCTENYMHFSLTDRLRILVSGRLSIRLVQYTNVQVDVVKNRVDWQIKYPGER